MTETPAAKQYGLSTYIGVFAILLVITTIGTFTASSIKYSIKKSSYEAKIEWDLTQIVWDERAAIEKYSPSAARDAYISHTDKILGKRMVTLDEYGDITALGIEATLQASKDYFAKVGQPNNDIKEKSLAPESQSLTPTT